MFYQVCVFLLEKFRSWLQDFLNCCVRGLGSLCFALLLYRGFIYFIVCMLGLRFVVFLVKEGWSDYFNFQGEKVSLYSVEGFLFGYFGWGFVVLF